MDFDSQIVPENYGIQDAAVIGKLLRNHKFRIILFNIAGYYFFDGSGIKMILNFLAGFTIEEIIMAFRMPDC